MENWLLVVTLMLPDKTFMDRLVSPDYSTREICELVAVDSVKANAGQRLLRRDGTLIGTIMSHHCVDGRTEEGRLLRAMYLTEKELEP